MPEERLRIAVQKSGRLSDGSFDLLAKCGLTISRGRDKLYGRAREMPVDILLVRDDDIPTFVADGACDIGILGGNVYEEYRLTSDHPDATEAVLSLNFARCKLMLAAPKSWKSSSIDACAGKRVATPYPGLTGEFFRQRNIAATTVMMSGSVEVAPRLRIADAVCDIVSTGATLDANDLAPAMTVFESEAMMVRNAAPFSPEKQATFDALLKRVRGVLASKEAKYVMMNAPRAALPAITEILPGAEAPTVLELAGEPDRVAIHAVCGEAVFWSTLEKLTSHGASAILVLPIEKILP